MKLTLIEKYKTLEPFETELPDFTILTGLNGAGKTQILRAIEDKVIQVTNANIDLKLTKYVTNYSLSPDDSIPATKEYLIDNMRKIYANYSYQIQRVNSGRDYRNMPTDGEFLGSIEDSSQRTVFEKLALKSGKSVLKLTHNDFFDNDLFINKIEVKDIFNQNFSKFFKSYYDRLDNSRYNIWKSSQKDKDIELIAEEEFMKLHGEPPWDLLNRIFSEAKLDYLSNKPVDLHRDAEFKFELINIINGAEVNFSDLSSGEKILMSLALALYNSELDAEFPEVLLMDEPDASLHPSMSKQFLDVIQNVFVKEKGVKVIMTTHSPSTIALASEEAIFMVNKAGERIEKASKDEALKILTTGVPSFSVNYENRRQVFVESSNDVYFYEKMYGKLSNYLEPEISLSFISSGESRTDKNGRPVSNCEQVVNIAKILRDSGNKFIFGIIDWDTKNSSNDYVKVLGGGKRYNIENYIFDPIFISALLFQEQEDGFTRENLKLEENESYSDFKNLTSEKLQIISDFLTNKVAEKIKSVDEEKLNVQYLNEKEIKIPRWFLHHPGHELESCLKDIFPKLRRFSREQALKKEVIDKYIDNIPEFISQDILDVFKQIQIV